MERNKDGRSERKRERWRKGYINRRKMKGRNDVEGGRERERETETESGVACLLA